MLLNERITKMKHINSGEEIVFTDGLLTATQEGYLKQWGVSLTNVDSIGLFAEALDRSEQMAFEIICENDKKYNGEALVKRLGPDCLELLGTGPLKKE